MYVSMLHGWGGFVIIYFIVSAVPSIVLAVRGFGWNARFFVVSLLVTWTGGGWFIMTFIAVMKKPVGMALHMDNRPVRDPYADL